MKLFAFLILLVAAQAKTTQDGVYTAAQATRGEAVYGQKCVSCHGADLTGDGQASPLIGKDFSQNWTDQSLGDLFERINSTMPADAPGTLKPAEVADVTAYILKKNAFPEGESELATERSALKDIKFVAPKQ